MEALRNNAPRKTSGYDIPQTIAYSLIKLLYLHAIAREKFRKLQDFLMEPERENEISIFCLKFFF